MIGLLLILIGTGAREVRSVLTKRGQDRFTIEQLGALTAGFGFIALAISAGIGYFNGTFVPELATASLPFLGIRIVLEIIQAVLIIKAMEICDRSSYSLLRVLTIPLLVVVDVLIGYTISWLSILGIGIVCIAFLVEVFISHDINRKGRKYALATAVNAVLTMSLYKYNLETFGNSVEVEQCIIMSSIFIFFVGRHFIRHRRNLFYDMSPRYVMSMGTSVGLSVLLISYAYFYLIPSIATTLRRAFSMIYAVIAGTILFHEKHFRSKIMLTFVVICGISLMMLT